MGMTILYVYISCIIWQYHPRDMYIHLHTIGLIGMMEIGTNTFHFAPNQRPFHLSISRWKLLRPKKNIFIFGKSFKSSFSLYALSFSFFNI